MEAAHQNDFAAATIKLLNDKIDAVEKVAKKPEKRWFETPSVIISLLALSVSAGGFIYNFQKDRQSDIFTRQQNLNKIVNDLSDIARETAALKDPFSDPREQAIAHSLNNRRYVLLAAADRLVEDLGDKALPSELAVLGVFHSALGNYEKPHKYYTQMTRKEFSPMERLNGYRSLAALHFNKGPASVPEGRAQFRNALSVVSKPFDIVSAFEIANVHLNWSVGEAAYGNKAEASEQLIAALGALETVPCIPQRKQVVQATLGKLKELGAAELPADAQKIVSFCG